ncbi:hypothetical protein BX666DRAFT_1069352 [Dichotomocladium elegans]|nr:hypothetical protein BX666DRAFT_1069352 [Dichotomocladium elegans]
MTLLGFVSVHSYYIMKNQTTIEHISRRPYEVRIDFDMTGHNYEIVTTRGTERLWDVGRAQNWRIIMGNNPWGWFLPISGSLGDGCVFPFNDTVYKHVVERARRQRELLNPITPPRPIQKCWDIF